MLWYENPMRKFTNFRSKSFSQRKFIIAGSLSSSLCSVLLLLLEIPGSTATTDESVISLSKLNVREDAITISGFSAGSSMATQLHVAHSSLFHGAALFSQVFYRCGPNSLVEFGLRCSKMGRGIFPYPLKMAVGDARRYEGKGLIDSLSNLSQQRLFVWIGTQDEFIPTEMASQNVDFYQNFISNPESSISLNVTKANHLIPTTNYGNGCEDDASEHEYLGNCNYPGAFHALEFLLRDKIQPFIQQENLTSLSPLRMYNQSEFYYSKNIHDVAMGTKGFIYIPSGCLGPADDDEADSNNKKCFLHLNFHGCNEWPPEVAKKYIVNSGFLQVAEVNRIILIFPLTTKVAANMGGCWDFWSYTGAQFATKNGSQIKVIHSILKRILHGL